jgi:aromatic-L-amino-acid decarboxylase
MIKISLDELRRACATPPEHPSPELLRATGHQVMDAMLADFLTLGEAGIGVTASRTSLESLLREPPPEDGIDLGRLLAEFDDKVKHNSFRPSHPRFLAFIPGAPSFASILGECLASTTNFFAGVWKEASGPTQVEIIVLDWFKLFLGYPESASGIITSGGSEANLTALTVAREQAAYADWPRLMIYTSEHRHWSIDRAAKIIGLRADQVRPLACDMDFRLHSDALTEAMAEDERAGRKPWLVVANAGATNTGAIDQLDVLADLCRERGLWLHIDAAYGWAASLTGEGRQALRGIQRADSLTLDPHKWLAQPFEAGCLLIGDGDLLPRTFAMRPEYMQDVVPNHDEINFCDHGLALTRRFRAFKIWFSIKLLGLAWHRRLIEHCVALTDYAQGLLESAGCFEITSERKLSIVCFRYVPRRSMSDDAMNALQKAIAAELLRTGRAFLSTTRLHGHTTLRFCFVNYRTSSTDIEEIISLLQQIGNRLA